MNDLSDIKEHFLLLLFPCFLCGVNSAFSISGFELNYIMIKDCEVAHDVLHVNDNNDNEKMSNANGTKRHQFSSTWWKLLYYSKEYETFNSILYSCDVIISQYET